MGLFSMDYVRSIKIKEAVAILKKQIDIRERLKKKIEEQTSIKVEDDIHKYCDGVNCFIFSSTALKQLLDQREASHLMVIIGAHPVNDEKNGFKEGQPTVMLLGCKEDEIPKEKLQDSNLDPSGPVQDDDVAMEHPPFGKVKRIIYDPEQNIFAFQFES